MPEQGSLSETGSHEAELLATHYGQICAKMAQYIR